MIGITDRSSENVGVLDKKESLDRNFLHLGKKVIILEISWEKYRKLKKKIIDLQYYWKYFASLNIY